MTRIEALFAGTYWSALLVLARSSRDPYLAPFAGPVSLSEAFAIIPRGRPPRLGFLTPMERDEAAKSGLSLLTPERLDVERWNRDGAAPHELLGNVISRGLHLCELAPGQIGLAGCVEAGRLRATCELLEREGWSFTPGEDAVLALRKQKTASELDRLRQVARGTTSAIRKAAEVLAGATIRDSGGLLFEGEPLTVGRLRTEIAGVLARHGLEEPQGNIVAPGTEGAVPHSIGTDNRELREGESLIVDVFPRESVPWGSFFADCTRTFCLGEPLAAVASAHARVVAALELARSHCRPGILGWTIQEAVCEHFDRAGYPTPITSPGTTHGYVHGLGHGIGLEVHETPSFKEHANGDDGRLAVGDVFTLEPGLYDPAAGWAVRLEDLYVLGEDGLENLTPLPYALDPRAW